MDAPTLPASPPRPAAPARGRAAGLEPRLAPRHEPGLESRREPHPVAPSPRMSLPAFAEARSPAARQALQPSDFAMLADFRHELRRFAQFSETEAHAQGLAPQQHQALLAIKGSRHAPTVTELAQRLCIKTHSAAELVNRLAQMGLVARSKDPGDGRRLPLRLTPLAEHALDALSATHLDQLRRIRPLLVELLAKFGG